MNIKQAFEDFQVKSELSIDGRIRFYGMLNAMLTDGLPLDTALRELKARQEMRKNPFAKLIKRWLHRLEKGYKFGEALVGYVPNNELVLISAGERSNELAIGFEQASTICTAQRRIKGALLSNLVMPAILLLVFFTVVINFSLHMAPELARVVPPDRWPGSGKLLYQLSRIVADWWKIAGLTLAGLVTLIIVTLPVWVSRLRDEHLNKLPPWSVYRTYSSATFMIALSCLLRAGVPLVEALKYIRGNASPWVRAHVATMLTRIRAGMTYGDAMDTGLLEPRVADEIAVYSKASNFDDAMKAIGKRVIEYGIETIQAQAAIVRNVAMVLVAVAVGWIYLTTFSLNSEVAKQARAGSSASASR